MKKDLLKYSEHIPSYTEWDRENFVKYALWKCHSFLFKNCWEYYSTKLLGHHDSSKEFVIEDTVEN